MGPLCLALVERPWLGFLRAHLSPVEPTGFNLHPGHRRVPSCAPLASTALRDQVLPMHMTFSLPRLLFCSEGEIAPQKSRRPPSQGTLLPPVTLSALTPATSDFSLLPKAKYIGCYLDDTQSRALRGVSFFDYKKMTVFRCQDNCAER